MALPSTTVWEVQTGGNDLNGGGFNSASGGVDWSTVAGQQATLTTASTGNIVTATIDVDAGDYTCSDSDVGNILNITGGSATPGSYTITARASQTWTLDRSAGASGNTVIGRMGGAKGSPGGLGAVLAAHGVAKHKGFVKSGTYTLSNAAANVSGGPLDLGVGNMLNNDCFIEGYETTRGDLGAKPEINCGAITPSPGEVISLDGANGAPHHLVNFHIDGNNKSIYGIRGSGVLHNSISHCLVEKCDGSAGVRGVIASHSKVQNCVAQGFWFCTTVFCWADACQTYGFVAGNGAYGCIASNISFSSGAGFRQYYGVFNCVAYNCTGDGFMQYNDEIIANCISINSAQYEFEMGPFGVLINSASWVTGSGRTNGQAADYNPITLTADPFVDAANGDFRLNNHPSGGLLCRGAGLGVYGQAELADVGAIPQIYRRHKRMQVA